MIGAPRGQFPGGLTNIPVSIKVCQHQFPLDQVLTFNETQILECFSREGNRTGLVYQCSLSMGDCTAPLGNGDAMSPDGLLFDRVGKSITVNSFCLNRYISCRKCGGVL